MWNQCSFTRNNETHAAYATEDSLTRSRLLDLFVSQAFARLDGNMNKYTRRGTSIRKVSGCKSPRESKSLNSTYVRVSKCEKIFTVRSLCTKNKLKSRGTRLSERKGIDLHRAHVFYRSTRVGSTQPPSLESVYLWTCLSQSLPAAEMKAPQVVV